MERAVRLVSYHKVLRYSDLWLDYQKHMELFESFEQALNERIPTFLKEQQINDDVEAMQLNGRLLINGRDYGKLPDEIKKQIRPFEMLGTFSSAFTPIRDTKLWRNWEATAKALGASDIEESLLGLSSYFTHDVFDVGTYFAYYDELDELYVRVELTLPLYEIAQNISVLYMRPNGEWLNDISEEEFYGSLSTCSGRFLKIRCAEQLDDNFILLKNNRADWGKK